MQADLEQCNMQFLFFSAIAALGILGLIIGRKIFKKIPGLIRAVKMHSSQEKPVMLVDIYKEVEELKKATLQISADWTDLKSLLASIREQQSGFGQQLSIDLESMGDRLQKDVRTQLEEECLRGDQRFGEMHALLDAFRENFLAAIREQKKEASIAAAEASTQTEAKKRQREGSDKDGSSSEGSQHRSFINVIKKALMEFHKEAMHQMALQREEAMKAVLVQLTEDREDLKATIQSAFTTATHHTETNFVQFGNIGRDALKCVAVLNENTERTLAKKFKESGDKLNNVGEQLRNLNFDLSSIKTTLDSIDGQFDEIYKKLDLGCQKNSDQAEEVANGLQKTAQEWNERATQLDETCKQLACATHGIKDMLVSLDNTLCNRPPEGSVMSNSEHSVLTASTLCVEREGFGVVLMTVQLCQEKLSSMKEQIERDTSGMKRSADVLQEELKMLTNLVQNSVETWKDLATKLPDSEDCYRALKHEQVRYIGDVDMHSEMTEESHFDNVSQYSKLEGAEVLPGLMEFIDANLKKAQHTTCIGNITENSEFFNKSSNE